MSPDKFRAWLEKMARQHIVDDEERLNAVDKLERLQRECERIRSNRTASEEVDLLIDNLHREWGRR